MSDDQHDASDGSSDSGSVRRTTLPPTSQRLTWLARELDDIEAGLPAAELLERCWPAALSVATVEAVLVDEGLRDAPATVVRRHRRETRGRQAQLLSLLVEALGADAVDQRRGDALLLGDEYETSTDEAHIHIGWWVGDDGPSLHATVQLKDRLRRPLRAIVTDQNAGDVVRGAAALAEITLHLGGVTTD